MMRRKHRRDDHENLERWLVSYADFITLLFAFFVVMYSISSVNEGKYKVLSETLNAVFSDSQKAGLLDRSSHPVQIGIVKRSPDRAEIPIAPDQPPSSPEVIDEYGGEGADDLAQMKSLADQMERALAPYIQEDLIELKRQETWIEVEMKSGLLFPSGRSDLVPEAVPVLAKLADIVRTVPNTIHVEGHTDNKPINTREFPSNWELSAARAASVVHELMRDGVEPGRMAAIAYGEHHPIENNDSEDGRYRNRRVTLILQSRTASRFQLPASQAMGNVTAPAKARESGPDSQSR
ncbi:MAG: flagellar motor protein MotD [Proteobacteria bacterium]|nr:flagellar motor protein MotD [Pseudomonadota bacterium]